MDAVRKVNAEVPIKTEVYNQKDEGTCGRLAFADMVTIVLRMTGSDPDLDLTPQIFIDTQSNLQEIIAMCVDDDKGLEKITDYPFARLGRNIPIHEWSEKYYESPPSQRYRLQRIDYYNDPTAVKGMILWNFDEGGRHYPIFGAIHPGPRIEDRSLARGFYHSTIPYRHLPNEELSTIEHNFLIVGVNTMSDNPEEHYCLVKNTHGIKWGVNGYSKVGFEVFLYILVPVQQTQAEMMVEAEAETDASNSS